MYLKIEMVFVMTSPFMNIKHMFLQKIIQILLVSKLSPGLLRESFIKIITAYFLYPAKDAEVIQQPNITSRG